MSRTATIHRTTAETDIRLRLNLDGQGKSRISTGIRFFDHMLDLVARHGAFDLSITAEGDLDVDQHHTVEDVGITLGEAVQKSRLKKRHSPRRIFLDAHGRDPRRSRNRSQRPPALRRPRKNKSCQSRRLHR